MSPTFPADTSEATVQPVLSTSRGSDLWPQNSVGVIIRLQGTSTGAMLTLGREEIFIRRV